MQTTKNLKILALNPFNWYFKKTLQKWTDGRQQTAEIPQSVQTTHANSL